MIILIYVIPVVMLQRNSMSLIRIYLQSKCHASPHFHHHNFCILSYLLPYSPYFLPTIFPSLYLRLLFNSIPATHHHNHNHQNIPPPNHTITIPTNHQTTHHHQTTTTKPPTTKLALDHHPQPTPNPHHHTIH